MSPPSSSGRLEFCSSSSSRIEFYSGSTLVPDIQAASPNPSSKAVRNWPDALTIRPSVRVTEMLTSCALLLRTWRGNKEVYQCECMSRAERWRRLLQPKRKAHVYTTNRGRPNVVPHVSASLSSSVHAIDVQVVRCLAKVVFSCIGNVHLFNFPCYGRRPRVRVIQKRAFRQCKSVHRKRNADGGIAGWRRSRHKQRCKAEHFCNSVRRVDTTK